MACKDTSIIYPLLADIYYPNVEQKGYGNIEKEWILNKTVACFFAPASRKSKQEVQPEMSVSIDQLLIGRTKCDVRVSSLNTQNSVTNVIISNIRDAYGNPIYIETSGVRANKSTIFEIATNEPIVGPFGTVEYYSVTIRRSENQGINV
jgi:hypothetical protein